MIKCYSAAVAHTGCIPFVCVRFGLEIVTQVDAREKGSGWNVE